MRFGRAVNVVGCVSWIMLSIIFRFNGASIGTGAPSANPVEQLSPLSPEIAVLKVQGQIDFTRQGWTTRQPLLAGSLITPDDLIFPQSASLLVMCPDSTTHEFLAVDLIPNTVINCPKAPKSYVVGSASTAHLSIQRGGSQSAAIPYLISPRATVVRTLPVELRWNAVPNVQSYSLTVRGGGENWQSGPVDPANVVQGVVARFRLDKPLQEKTAYTVEICVAYLTGDKHCTTDPDWSTGENVAFYYVAAPTVNDAERQLTGGLGAVSPESRYARAVLLGQPFYVVSPSLSLGIYGEAIDLLEQIRTADPNSALATAPGLYILLGDLYRRIDLQLSAAKAYQQAVRLAPAGTQAAAASALGLATTSPDSSQALNLYNEVLDDYAKFLDQAAFASQLSQLCQQIGDVRFDLTRCQSVSGS